MNTAAPGTTHSPSAHKTVGRHPDFLIIGAAKSATSWLTRCLGEHPSVVIPTGELHHFSWYFDANEPLPASYLDHYRDTTSEQVCGENSNTYLSHKQCPDRIYKYLPHAKLIISLRNPIDRAYSDYAMRLRQDYRLEDIERFLDPDRAPDLAFLDKGLYLDQIKRYLAFFPINQMHFLLLDDVQENPQEQFSRVCRFLEVDDTFVPPSLTAQVNTKNRVLLFPRLRANMQKSRSGRWVLSKIWNTPLHGWLRSVFARHPAESKPMPSWLRSKLRDYYRPHVLELGAFLGRDLSHWLD